MAGHGGRGLRPGALGLPSRRRLLQSFCPASSPPMFTMSLRPLSLLCCMLLLPLGVLPQCTTQTLGGSSSGGWLDGEGTNARFTLPQGLTTNGSTLFVADTGGNRIRAVSVVGSVTTLAGSGYAGLQNGVGGGSSFNAPAAVSAARDGSRALFVADSLNNVVRLVNTSTGMVTTYSGLGAVGYFEGPSQDARYNRPSGLILLDPINPTRAALVVADTSNCRIRLVSPTPPLFPVSLLAGSGTCNSVDGTRLAASFNFPNGISALSSSGPLFVAESSGHRVRMVTLGGVVTTLAGSGGGGFAEGLGLAALFSAPSDVAVDPITGFLWVADTSNNRLRGVVASSGLVNTLVGTGAPGTTNGSPATMTGPRGVCVWPAAGGVVFSDTTNNQLRLVVCPASSTPTPSPTVGTSPTSSTTPTPTPTPSPTPITAGRYSGCMVSTVAGALSNCGVSDSVVGGAAGAPLGVLNPSGIAQDPVTGTMYVTNSVSHRIIRVASNGTVRTVAGNGVAGWVDAVGTNAQINTPQFITYTSNLYGNGTRALVFCESSGNKVRAMDPVTFAVWTIAGGWGGSNSGWQDGTGTGSLFFWPWGITALASGFLVVTDNLNFRVRVIGTGGEVSTLAGFGGLGSTNGVGTSGVTFNNPRGITASPGGVGPLYVVDSNSYRIRQITLGGVVTTLVGTGSNAWLDGIGTTASLQSPVGVSFYDADTLLITELVRVRSYSVSTGVVSTVVGTGLPTGVVTGSGLSVALSNPYGLTQNTWGGGVVFTDTSLCIVRRVVCSVSATPTPSPTPSIGATPSNSPTPTPCPSPTSSPTPSPAASAPPGSCVLALLAGSALGNSGFTDSPVGTTAVFSLSLSGLAMDSNGTLYASDRGNNRIRRVTSPLGGGGGGSSGAAATTTLVGTGGGGWLDATGTSAMVSSPEGLWMASALDGSPTPLLLFCDSLNHRVRGVYLPNATTLTLAGTGIAGWAEGPALSTAQFNTPMALVSLPPGGAPSTIYIADSMNSRIRVMSVATGLVSTLAGNGVAGSSEGVGTGAASLSSPRGIAYAAPTPSNGNGLLYVSDFATHRLVSVDPGTGAVRTVGGCGFPGWLDGVGTLACFNTPSQLWWDPSWGVLVADTGSNVIRALPGLGVRGGGATAATVTTIAGSGAFGNALLGGGPALGSPLKSPLAVLVAPGSGGGQLVFSDTGNGNLKGYGCPSSRTPSFTPSPTPTLGGASASPSPTPLPSPTSSPQGCTIRTLAGQSGIGGMVDSPIGTSAMFNNPKNVAALPNGTVFVTDMSNHRIRAVSPRGNVTTLAGSGGVGWVDGQGLGVVFNNPSGIALNPTGTLLYISETGSHRLRTLTVASGVSGTLAGTGTAGYVNGQGTAASFYQPEGVAVSPTTGVIYVADSWNHRIRLAFPNGTVGWLCGSGTLSYADGPPASAMFYYPRSIHFSPWGLLYVGDNGFSRIRIVNPITGWASTLAGSGSAGYVEGAPLTASFNGPYTMSYDPWNLGAVLVADTGNNRIRTVNNVTGWVGTWAGTGVALDTNGFAVLSGVWSPRGITVATGGGPGGSPSIILAGGGSGPSHVIRVVTCPPPSPTPTPSPSFTPGLSRSPSPSISLTPSTTPSNLPTGCYVAPFAGTLSTSGFSDGTGFNSNSPPVYFGSIGGIAFNPVNAFAYVTDMGNYRVRQLSSTATVTTVAGSFTMGQLDGTGAGATFTSPRAIAIHPTTGVMYVVDQPSRLRAITPSVFVVTSLAGSATSAWLDGVGAGASFNNPQGLTVDPVSGAVFVGDTNNNRIRVVTPGGVVTTLCGSGVGGSTNGVGTLATLSGPVGVALNASGALYVVESVGRVVRVVIVASGLVSTLAGSGSNSWVDGVGALAAFNSPFGATLDYSQGFERLLVADSGNRRIRAVNPATRTVTTLVGSSTSGAAPGFGSAGMLSSPRYIAPGSPPGVFYITDSGTTLVHRMTCPLPIPTPSPTPTMSPGASPSASPTVTPSPTPTLPSTPTPTLTPLPGCAITTIAGTGATGFADSPATPLFNLPFGIAATPWGPPWNGTLLISDRANARVRLVYLNGTVRTYAGSGSIANTDGVGPAASLFLPYALSLTPNGTLYTVCGGGGVSRMARVVPFIPTSPTMGVVSTVGVGGSPLGAGVVEGMAVDPVTYTLYVADTTAHRLNSVSAGGVVRVGMAGTGVAGFRDGPMPNASFFSPAGLVLLRPTSMLYLADRDNHRIRFIDLVAGLVGTAGGSGVGGLQDGAGGLAQFQNPSGLALSPSGNLLYIADSGNSAIRSMALPFGVVTTLAGGFGTGLIDGAALGAARFNNPKGLTLGVDGALYIADTGSHAIRRYGCPSVSPSPTPTPSVSIGSTPSTSPSLSPSPTSSPTPSATTTPSGGGACYTARIAGTGGCCSGCNNCPALTTYYSSPSAIGVDWGGNAWIMDSGNDRICRVTPGGIHQTLLGATTPGYVDALGTASRWRNPSAVALDNSTFTNATQLSATFVVADTGNHLIRRFNLILFMTVPTSTIGGNGIAAWADGAATSTASFFSPAGVAVNASGAIYVSDTGNNRIRLIVGGWVSTLAGNGAASWIDGTGTTATFSSPRGLALSGNGLILYISDSSNNRIRALALGTLVVSTLAGSGASAWVDGTGLGAAFNVPYQIALDSVGNLVVADQANNRLRTVSTATGATTTLLNPSGASGMIDGWGSSPVLSYPRGIAFHPGTGVLFFTEGGSSNSIARRMVCPSASPTPSPTLTATPGTSITATPTPSTTTSPSSTPSPTATASAQGCSVGVFAGTGVVGSADGAALSTATFNQPYGVVWDLGGNAVVGELSNNRIRQISPTGVVTTLAGTGVSGSTDSAIATSALLSSPGTLAVNASNAIYFGEYSGSRVRVLMNGGVFTLAGGSLGFNDAVGTSAYFFYIRGIALLPNGFAVVADYNNNRVRLVSPGSTNTGVVSTLAGSGGSSSLDGIGTSASFSTLQGVTVDPATSTVYASESSPNRVRAITFPGRLVTTLSGSLGYSLWMDGPGATAAFASVAGMAWSSHPGIPGVLVCENSGSRIRLVGPPSSGGTTSTIAGQGVGGSSDGMAYLASFSNPMGVSSPNASGSFLVADSSNAKIRVVTCGMPSATPSPTPTLSLMATPSITPTPSPSVTPTNSPSQSPSTTPNGCTISSGTGGTNQPGYVDGPGGSARFRNPEHALYDPRSASGSLYITDKGNNVVRIVGGLASGLGTVLTLAGSGAPGLADGTGTLAAFTAPTGLAWGGGDGTTLLVADSGNHALRAVSPAGVVTTLVGRGVPGLSDGIGTTALLSLPQGVTVVTTGGGSGAGSGGGGIGGGLILIADSGNNAIRAVNSTTLTSSTISGCGAGSWVDGIGQAACFKAPSSLVFDPVSGMVYVADSSNSRVRALTLVYSPSSPSLLVSVLVSTLAGGSTTGYVDAVGPSARFSSTLGQISLGAPGSVLVVDAGNCRVRSVSIATGATTLFAGSGVCSSAFNGPAVSGWIDSPRGVARNPWSGVVQVVDTQGQRLRPVVCPVPPSLSPTPSITPSPSIGASTSPTPSSPPTSSRTPTASGVGCYLTTSYGTLATTGTTDSPPLFNGPYAIASVPGGAAPGTFVMSDRSNHRIRRLLPGGGVVTVAGSNAGYSDGSVGLSVAFNSPTALAYAPDGATLYIVDTGNHRIRSMMPSGATTTFAGSGIASLVDGMGTMAGFNGPEGGLVVSQWGWLYVSDSNNNCIRSISPGGMVAIFAGFVNTGNSDGVGVAATFNRPQGLAMDATGTFLYVCDTYGSRIRRIALASATVTTLAGSGSSTWADGVGVGASFFYPFNIVIDTPGTFLYVSDGQNYRLRKITIASGVVTTIAGNGLSALVDGFYPGSSLVSPRGLAIDPTTGQLIVADQGGQVVRSFLCPSQSPSPTPTQTPSSGSSASPSPPPSSSALGGSSSPSPSPNACTVQTVAGTSGTTGYADGVFPGTLFSGSGQLPLGVDATTGAAYVAEYQNHRVRRVSGTTTSTLAGTGTCNSASGWGTSAGFCYPSMLCMDPTDGTIITTDGGYGYVTRVSPSGLVSKLMIGAGFVDGPLGVGRMGAYLRVCTVDASGGVYLSDSSALRLVSSIGTITTMAGATASGYVDAIGTAARLSSPDGLLFDAVRNGVYISDTGNARLRWYSIATGAVTTLAGGPSGYVDAGVGTSARFNGLAGLAFGAGGVLIVADVNNNRLRIVTPPSSIGGPWSVGTFAGSGVSANVDGAAIGGSSFINPRSVASGPGGSPLFVSDATTVRAILCPSASPSATITPSPSPGSSLSTSPTPTPTTSPSPSTTPSPSSTPNGCTLMPLAGLAGSPSNTDGQGSNARFIRPVSGALDPATNTLLMYDSSAFRLRAVGLTGVTTTVAGGLNGYVDNGSPLLARFGTSTATGVGVDSAGGGNVYIADATYHRIRVVLGGTSGGGGGVRTYAGTGSASWVDGPLLASTFSTPSGLVVGGPPGATLTIADTNNHRVRVAFGGMITTLAGSGMAQTVDGVGSSASFNAPRGLCLDTTAGGSTTLYVSEVAGHVIRAVSLASGAVTTLAGTAGVAGSLDSAIGTLATFNAPWHLTMDSLGNILVADANNHEIRSVASATGAVSTLVGTGVAGSTVGSSGVAQLNTPYAIVHVPTPASAAGAYILDTFNFNVRWLSCPAWLGLSLTPTPSVSPTATLSPSTSGTPTGTPTVSGTGTFSGTGSGSDSGSPTSTFTPSGTVTSTTSPSGTPSATATATATLSATPTESGTPTFTPSPSISLSSSVTPTETPTSTSSVTQGASSSATPTPTLTSTSSPSQTPSGSDTTSPTPSPSLAAESPSPTNTPPNTLSPTPSLTSSPSVSSSLSSSITPSASPTFTPPVTPTASPSLTSTSSTTATLGSSASVTGSGTPSSSITPSTIPSATGTPSSTPSLSSSPTSSITPVAISPVGVGSVSGSGTISPTPTPTFSASITPTPSSTMTLGGSPASTPSPNPSPSATLSQTPSPTPTTSTLPSGTSTISSSPTASLTRGVSPSGTGSDSTSGTPTPSSSGTGSGTASSTPSTTLSGSTTISTSPTASLTQGVSPSNTASKSLSGSVTPPSTPSPTSTVSPTRSGTGTASITPSSTLSGSSTITLSPTASISTGLSASNTGSNSLSSSSTGTQTPSPTATETPTISGTGTASITPSTTLSGSSTLSFSPTSSLTQGVSPSTSGSASFSSSKTGAETPTPTSSGSPTSSGTPTPSLTPSSTLSSSSSMTLSPTASVSLGLSASNTGSNSLSSSPTGTQTPSPSSTPTPTSSSSSTASVTPSTTLSASSTLSSSPTSSLTRGASASESGSPSTTPSLSSTDTPTSSSTGTPTSTSTETPEVTPTSTLSGSSTESSSQTPSLTRGASPSNTPSVSSSPSTSGSGSISALSTPTPTSSATSTPTPTTSSTLSGSSTVSISPTSSLTSGASPSNTPSSSRSPSVSATQSPSGTGTVTSTGSGTGTPSGTVTASQTSSLSQGASPSITPSGSSSLSSSSTASLSGTSSNSPSGTGTPSTSSISTLTSSPSGSLTASLTPGVSSSSTSTSSLSASPSGTPSPTLSTGASPSSSSTTTLTSSPTPSPTSSLSLGASPSVTGTASSSPSVGFSLASSPLSTTIVGASSTINSITPTTSSSKSSGGASSSSSSSSPTGTPLAGGGTTAPLSAEAPSAAASGIFSSASGATTFGSTAGASAVMGVAGVGLYQWWSSLTRKKKRNTEVEVKKQKSGGAGGRRSINSPLRGSLSMNSGTAGGGGRGGGKQGKVFSVENPLQRNRV